MWLISIIVKASCVCDVPVLTVHESLSGERKEMEAASSIGRYVETQSAYLKQREENTQASASASAGWQRAYLHASQLSSSATPVFNPMRILSMTILAHTLRAHYRQRRYTSRLPSTALALRTALRTALATALLRYCLYQKYKHQ